MFVSNFFDHCQAQTRAFGFGRDIGLHGALKNMGSETRASVGHGEPDPLTRRTPLRRQCDLRFAHLFVRFAGLQVTCVLCVLQQVVDHLTQLLGIALNMWASGIQCQHNRHPRMPIDRLLAVQAHHFMNQGIEIQRLKHCRGQAGIVAKLIDQSLHGIHLVDNGFDGLDQDGLIRRTEFAIQFTLQPLGGQLNRLASADGEQYIQVSDNSPIYIGTGWPDSLHEWQFGTDGKLTVPGAIGTTSNSKLDLVGLGPNTAYLTSTSDDTTALYLAAAVAELRANTTVSIYTNTGDTSLQWTFGADGTTSFPNAAIDGGTAPIELKSRSWSQLTYNNNDMTPEPNKNHSTTFFVEGGDALLEIFRWDNNSVLQHRQWTFSSDGSLTLPTVLSGDTSIGTEFNTNPPGHTLTLKHNGGVGSGSGGELKFDYGTAEIKIVQDVGTTQIWTFGTDGGLTFPDNTTQTTAFTGNPDLTPYAKITDFVHLSGDTMTGDLYAPTLSAGNIYSENSINAVGQFSFQNGDFISSTDGTGNFVDLRNANYYQLNFVNTSDNGAGDWHVGNYIPWGSFSWYITALGRSMLDLIDGTQGGYDLGVYFYDNVSINAGAPLAKLHVKGSSNDVNTPIAIIESDGSQAPYTFRVGGVNRAYVKGDSNGKLAFGAQNFIAFEAGGFGGAAEAMRITAEKNIGIGTTAPSEKLEVVGNLKVTNNITAYDIAAQNQVQYLSSGVVKVYQFYNSSTNSLDTIFA